MRPLKLIISGLNSFKDEQEIDFEKLSDLGIFGIFGPTGSGKSSILDAITLALYGTVVRAERDKQGIINHAEKKSHVSLTFALGAGEQRHIYRVERAYRTKDHISVQSIHARMMDITTGVEEILAEREKEVNRYIEDLLGLKAEDFMRAVVLPQGSFADFLKMESGKRRVMLERLFTLEKYGRQLTDKLSKRLESANLQYNRLDGEQKGLGDASADKLQEAERHKSVALAAEQVAVQCLGEVNATYETSRTVHELQQEVASKDGELAHHQQNSDHIKKLRIEVERAELAGQVKPIIDERNNLDRKMVQAEEGYRRTSGQLEQLQQQADALYQEWQRTKTHRMEREPELIEKKAQLDAAQILETEVSELGTKIRQVDINIKTEQNSFQAATDQIARCSEMLEGLSKDIMVMEKTLGEQSISSDYRQLVQQAGNKADALEREGAALTACQSNCTKRHNKVVDMATILCAAEKQAAELTAEMTTLSCAEKEAQAMCPGDEEALGQQEIRLTELKTKLREMEAYDQKRSTEQASIKRLTTELETAQGEYQSIQTRYEASQTHLDDIQTQLNELLRSDWQTMAANMAKKLEMDQPCPVCGSTHHPAPAVVSSHDAGNVSKEELEGQMMVAKGQFSDMAVLLRKAEGQIIGTQTKLDAAKEQVQALNHHLGTEVAAIGHAWELTTDQLTLPRITEWANIQEQSLARAKEQLKAWRMERQLADRRIREWEQRFAHMQKEIAAYRADHHNAEAELERVQRECTAMTQQVEEFSSQLVAILREMGSIPELQLVDPILLVEKLREELISRDRHAESLQTEIRKKRTAQQQGQSQRDELLKIEQQLKESIAVLQSRCSEMIQTARDKQEQLNQVSKGISVNLLLTQVAGELRELREKESTAEEGYNTNQERLSQMKQQVTIEQTQFRSLSIQFHDMVQRLAQKLLEVSLATEREVEAAYLDVAVLEEKRKEITVYADEERKLMAQRKELLAKLRGQSISKTDWETLKQQLSDAMINKDRATEARIHAESIVNDIVARHERWQVLENELVVLREQLKHLNTLKSLIRGNMLVEFMAQEQMDIVLSQASERLKHLTNNRYALELASDGSFLIRDDDNGGARRPVNMLSGGETFQTSLALALALSTHIQLRGQHPLEFFFLDEGFGSLDQKSLEVVMSSLERLPLERMVIGLISHVDTLQQRLLRRLIVEPAEPNGRGSQVRVEMA